MHLYLHIPFCRQACHYCDFHFSTNLTYKERMVKAIAREIELQKDYLEDKKLKTIYFGGGTPSILSPWELDVIFDAIHKLYDTSDVQEVTLEANPDDITEEMLDYWYRSGVNRFSLGIQTFNDVYLKLMNRIHTSKEAKRSLSMILEKGFETSTADLIFAKTGLKLDRQRQAEILKNDIAILQSYDLKHISAYNLTITPQTVFGKWTERGQLAEITEEYAAEQYHIVVEELAKAGFEQYEISNFARDRKYAVHNTSYWQDEEYLGVGPAAHSYNHSSRQWNINNNHKYMAAIEKGELNFEREILSPANKVNDYLLTGLRTIWGVSLEKIKDISTDFPEDFSRNVEEMIANGHLQQNGDILTIPQEKRILTDRIIEDLIWV